MKTRKNTMKKLLSLGLVVGLSVSTLATNMESIAKAEDTTPKTHNVETVVDKALDATVVERDGKVFVVVTAKADVTATALDLTIDGIKYDKVQLGAMVKGEVKEVEVELPEKGEAPVKRLPNTAAVTDSVGFEKEVQGHKIKGKVTFTYDNGVVAPGDEGTPIPDVPGTPNQPNQPNQPGTPNVPGTPSVPGTPNQPNQPGTPEQPGEEGLLPVDEELMGKLKPILEDAHKDGKLQYKIAEVDELKDLPVEYIEDAELEEGKEEVRKEGTPSKLRVTYRYIYVNGVHVPTYDMIVNRVEITPGQAKVVARGTKKKVDTPTTPEITDIEAGLPKNVKWTRSQLKAMGFGLGKITGNYGVDGDLGVFGNEGEADAAYKSGAKGLFNQLSEGKITEEEAAQAPHGYAWSSVTKPDGTEGVKVNLYGKDKVTNDGQPTA